MSDPTQTTSQIQDELLNEVKLELERRGTSQLLRKPEPADDTIGGFAVTAILACLALLAGTGAVMAMAYTPTLEDANASTAWFSAGTLGGVARAAHYHAANLLVLLAASYLGYMIWRGAFRRPAHWRWWRALALLGLAIAFSLSGQLLPFDQLAAHGTSIRLGYLAEAPVIGESLRQLAQGGETIGNATLARFFGLHAIVLPALTVILLRWLWRDTRSETPFTYTAGIAGAVLVLVVAAALLWHPPLGLQGNLDEPFPEARPEWFGLPLYALMRVAPPGPAHLLLLFAVPLLAATMLLALPYIETASVAPARLRKPLQLGLIGVIAGVLIFSAVPIIQDMSGNDGWFRKPKLEEVMLAMGNRNKALLNSAELPPADAHNHARDIMLLSERLGGLYPEKLDDAGKAKWDEISIRSADAARRMLYAPDGATQMKARAELREACTDCHKLNEKDIQVDPAGAFTPEVEKPQPKSFFFKQDVLAVLQPTKLERTNSTGRMMDQFKYSLRDILIAAEVVEDKRPADKPKRGAEQALTDLKAVIEIVAGHYEQNAGSFFDEKKWNDWIEELRRATTALEQAPDATEAAKRTATVGKACESCHAGADDPTEPIEWRFQSLLKPE